MNIGFVFFFFLKKNKNSPAENAWSASPYQSEVLLRLRIYSSYVICWQVVWFCLVSGVWGGLIALL